MNKNRKKWLLSSVIWLEMFAVWTVLLGFIDVQAIGPRESAVGFASLNQWFHGLTGVNMLLYTITDWLGLVPVGFAFCFAILGLIQWIRRKHILKVDQSILILGVFYIAVMAAYIFFEKNVVNYRPILIEGYLEASYPSSTTLLVMCVMPTALSQLRGRIQNKKLSRLVSMLIIAFIAFMVIGRLISGVHWVSDIIGGTLLSAGLVALYHSAI